jgi:hypothetical protein
MRTPSSDRVPHSRRTPSSNRQQDTTRRDDHQRPTTTTTNAHGNQPPYPPQTPKTGQPTKSVPRAKPLSGRAPRAGHLAHGTQQAPPEHPTSPPRTQLATPPIPPHGAPRAPAPTSTHAPTSHPTNATTVSHKAKTRDRPEPPRALPLSWPWRVSGVGGSRSVRRRAAVVRAGW